MPLLINDDVDVAAETGADGVHLGEHDGALALARQALGDVAIIGASCYDELKRAEQAAANGADYVAFGAFYPSSTKPAARKANPALLRTAAPLGLPRQPQRAVVFAQVHAIGAGFSGYFDIVVDQQRHAGFAA